MVPASSSITRVGLSVSSSNGSQTEIVKRLLPLEALKLYTGICIVIRHFLLSAINCFERIHFHFRLDPYFVYGHKLIGLFVVCIHGDAILFILGELNLK